MCNQKKHFNEQCQKNTGNWFVRSWDGHSWISSQLAMLVHDCQEIWARTRKRIMAQASTWTCWKTQCLEERSITIIPQFLKLYCFYCMMFHLFGRSIPDSQKPGTSIECVGSPEDISWGKIEDAGNEAPLLWHFRELFFVITVKNAPGSPAQILYYIILLYNFGKTIINNPPNHHT